MSGRDLPVEGIGESAGLYINTLPLVIDWDNEHSIQDQLQHIQQKITEMNTHSYADLAKLQRNGERLFHSLFVYENYPVPEANRAMSRISFRESIEKIDYLLSITVLEHDERLTISFGYDGDYITEEKAVQHIAMLGRVLQQVIQEPGKRHSAISLLSDEEYELVVHGWNATALAYPKDKTFYRLFEEQVMRTPGNIAVAYEERQLTYQELNERSNQLARYIRSQYSARLNKDLAPDTLIAIYMERNPELIVSILGIMKAGGAYVPMDTNYPMERIEFILEDSGAQLILVQSGQDTSLFSDDVKGKLVFIDNVSDEIEITDGRDNLPGLSTATDLAYVIYTSGTTGRPKGVMVNHSGLNNLAVNFIRLFKITASSRSSQLISISFDAALTEICPTLAAGGTICIVPDRIKQSEHLTSYLHSQDISHFTVPADLLGQMEWAELPELKSINVGGGVPALKSLDKWSNGRILYNTYGPTEITICATAFKFNPGDSNTNIGRPLNNTTIYVLDSFLQPVPLGVVGELYIGGAGVARGYLNRPELTEERFMANPFTDGTGENARLYKTGDLVRLMPDSNVEFIGRNDGQVKVRGYRIELGEIEHALMAIEGIKQACVVAKERAMGTGSSKYLVGYYVPEPVIEVTPAKIQLYLTEVLPEYMLPVAFVQLASLPLTVNGKLDRSALPEPVSGPRLGTYVAPVTAMEKELCSIWEGVLGLEGIGITEDFFRSGGDSILSIQLTSRICQAGFYCQVKDIFECRTVHNLAERLRGKNTAISIKSEQGILTGELKFLPVQKWFIEKVCDSEIVEPDYWNQSFLIKVPESDVSRLQAVIQQLVAYHDVLRIHFLRDNSVAGWRQVYQQEINVPELKILDVSEHTEKELQLILSEWQSTLDLECGPLFQAGYLYGYPDGSARIFLALHHMITDTVSWRILTDDVKALYEGRSLPAKGSSYRQWVETVENYAARYPNEMAWWKNQLQGIADFRISSQGVSAETESVELDEALTSALLQTASKAYNTEINDLLLTALAYAMKEIDKGDAQGITLEGHGREDIDPTIDHSHTIGWFTTMFPVKLELQGDIKESIQFIKESLRNIPNKGIGFGAFASAQDVNFGFNDLPPVHFNYLGQFDKKEANWQITAEESGVNTHPSNIDRSLVNINGMVSNGRLAFNISTRLGKEQTKLLSVALKVHLEQIIKHCGDAFDRSGARPTPSDFDDFVAYEIINDDSDEDPVFIFPPGTGGAESYYHTLVPEFKNRKLVMFNNFFLFMVKKGYKAADFTFEELAKYYRILIQKLQPTGNYTFLGWSFGGVLAYEVFKQMPGQVYDGSNLILLDSWFGAGKAGKEIPRELIPYFRQDINCKYNPVGKLTGLNTILFKADTAFEPGDDESNEAKIFEALQRYYLSIPANNIDLLVDKLQVINLNCHHFDMLEKYSDTISNYFASIQTMREMN